MVFAALTLVCALVIYACMPPAKVQDFALIGMCLLFGAVLGWLTYAAFNARNDATRYYDDRVEVFRRGGLLHRLAYTDVERVAYAVKPGESRHLNFSGPGGEPRLMLVLTDGPAGSEAAASSSPHALTEEKLTGLRDVLNDLVAQRMLRQMGAGRPVTWFDDVAMTPHGLSVGQQLVPWTQVAVSADDATGAVVLAAGPAGQRRTSMVEDNVVPGLMVVRQMTLQRKAA